MLMFGRFHIYPHTPQFALEYPDTVPPGTEGTRKETGLCLSADFVIYVVHQWVLRGCVGTALV